MADMNRTFPPIRAVLFDLDGTLVDSAPDLGAATNRLRQQRGLPPLPLDAYRPVAGAGARGLLRVAFGITPEHADFAPLREAFFDSYEQHLAEHTLPFDGIASLLAALAARGLPWGIVTNKPQRFTTPLVQRMALLHGAAVVVSGDTTAHAKPHPAPLLHAAEQIAVPAAHCLYIGDDKRDMDAAHAAHMPCAAAAWGYLGEHHIHSWGAQAILNCPGDVLRLLA